MKIAALFMIVLVTLILKFFFIPLISTHRCTITAKSETQRPISVMVSGTFYENKPIQLDKAYKMISTPDVNFEASGDYELRYVNRYGTPIKNYYFTPKLELEYFTDTGAGVSKLTESPFVLMFPYVENAYSILVLRKNNIEGTICLESENTPLKKEWQ